VSSITNIKYDASQAINVAQLFKDAPEIANQEFEAAITEALMLLEGEVKDRTPIGVSGGAGGLRGSITHALGGSKVNMQGKVFSPLPHAASVELGTKPHFPPVAKLVDWAEQKFNISREEAWGAAHAIALKIALHGTKGKFMFTEAFAENENQIVAMFDAAADRVMDRLGRKI